MQLGTVGPELDWDHLADLPAQAVTDSLFQSLSGSFTHTLLEWSAFCAALFIFFMSFIHYRLQGDTVTLIIGIALFAAGCMDAFHTLAADRLIEAVAPNTNLIPFTWAISRVFAASILVFGSLVILFFSRGRSKMGARVVILLSTALGITAYMIIHYCAVSETLPQTMYPDSLITRPWDVAPLLIFVFGGLYAFPKLYARHTNVFTLSLLLSAIPEIATELHMAFGSTALFDHHFNAAHFLKIVAYLIPLIGLSLDYVLTYQETQQAREAAEHARVELDQRANELELMNVDLSARNKELDDFAYVASHDLKAPLRGIDNLALWITEDAADVLPDTSKEHLKRLRQRVGRLEYLLDDLLAYSRAGREDVKIESVDTMALVKEIGDLLTSSNQFSVKIETPFPTLDTPLAPLKQVLMNLISNAIKHHDREDGQITLSANKNARFVHFSVQDDGPGISEEFHERIFGMFQSLQSRDEVESSGMGLAIVKKIVESQGGEIRLEPSAGAGSIFIFGWPITQKGND